jgi:CRISPR type IV-associated protein Csf2
MMNIDLTLTLSTPYHSAPISGPAMIVNNEGRIMAKTGHETGSPLTSTYKEPKYLASQNAIKSFPVIRSLQLVKQFRNAINRDVIESLKSRGLTIAKASTYAGMEVGAASGKPTGMNATLDQSIQALKEPIALLGGGSLCLPSTLKVSDANLLHESLVNEGLAKVPASYDISQLVTAEPYQLTYAVPVTRQDPINQLSVKNGLDQISVIEEYKSQILEWQSNVTQQRSSRAADSDVKKADLNNLVALEVVMAGLSFSAQLSVPDSAGDAVKGAVLSAVSEMCNQGMTIGGRSSRGFGQVQIQASVDGKVLDLDLHAAEIESYSNWLEHVTPATLAEFYEA